LLVFVYGLTTLRFDPLHFGQTSNSLGLSSVVGFVTSIAVIIVVSSAVASAAPAERSRVGWLLLPIPIAIGVELFGNVLPAFSHSWVVQESLTVISAVSPLLGAAAVTYALLRRRVLDFEFVISRTVVVATVSLIVVAAFTLLEWLLGTVLAGIGRTGGIVANAALALGLGLSLRYIHRRVDALVDVTLFRKRHEDERALLDFSKEAAFVTNTDALLDCTISIVHDHTDARNAALYLDGAGSYRTARSFGDNAQASVDENDGAILALKTWHKPLDPHRCSTSLRGALAVPMLGRGHLLGVLLLGERAGGEAYANDEIEALSEFAHGVGSALDSLSVNGNKATVDASLAKIVTMLEGLPDVLTSRLRST